MAFLFLSVALLPFSMKAVGFNINLNPRVGAVVEAWTQVAGVFVVGYHPFSASTWSSLDNLNSSDTPEVAPEESEQCSLIAQLYSIGSGERCDLTREPVEIESTPVTEARWVAPQAAQKMRARRAELAALATAVTIKAEDDAMIVKVPANLPAVAMKFVRAFSSRPLPVTKPMKRAERKAFDAELGRVMKEARLEKVGNITFEFCAGSKGDRIECEVDQFTNAIKNPEAVEKIRRIRVVETENTHEL
jgi:hypothetical protein